MLCRRQGCAGLTFPLYPGSGEGAAYHFVLLQASGPALLPEAVPGAGIDVSWAHLLFLHCRKAPSAVF